MFLFCVVTMTVLAAIIINSKISIAGQSFAQQSSDQELAAESNSLSATDLSYLFSGSEESSVHPAIINDMICWLSDLGDQVVSINLIDSQGSNRYFGEVDYGEEDQPWISYVPEERNWFGYKFIGRTESGVYVLLTAKNTGGSGTFRDVVFLVFSVDVGLQIDWDAETIHSTKERLLITKLGQSALGDRWSGELRIDGNKLFVGRDQGWFSDSRGTGGGWLSYDLQDRVLVFTDLAN